jgi:hypothetical protein
MQMTSRKDRYTDLNHTIISEELQNKCFLYVDASGDDGVDFTKRTTQCFAVALVVEHQERSKHNQERIRELRKVLRLQRTQELQYAAIRNSLQKERAWDIIHDMSVRVKVLCPIKSRLNASSHEINVNSHGFWVHHALHYVFKGVGADRVEIIIDESFRRYEEGIEKIIKEGAKEEGWLSRIDAIHFPSSRQYLMLQFSDVVAGAAREFVEANVGNRPRNCASCPELLRVQRRQRKCTVNALRRKTNRVELFDDLAPLLVRYRGRVIPEGLGPYPERDEWGYLDCILSERKKG